MAGTFKPLSGLVLMAGLLSGCNSASRSYPQGPWTAAQEPRSYPSYPAPWGGRVGSPAVESRDERIETVVMTAAPGEVVASRQPAHSTSALPYDPLPLQPAPLVDAAPDSAPVPVASDAGPSNAPTTPASQLARASPPGVFQKPKRASSYAGQWKAVDAKGASCKVQLSSTPVLDLYKAGASGCSDATLSGINAWSLRDDQIILFARGNAVARLSGEEASLKGTLNGSGASLTMSR